MALALRLSLIFIIFSTNAFAQEFTIFSGDKKGSYFAVAQGICNVYNRHYPQKCIARESAGSAKNLELLASGEADLAIIKTPEFNRFFIKNAAQLQDKIYLVGKLHLEYLIFVLPKNLEINAISDLNNKVVNIGTKGSTSSLIVEKYFSAFAIKPKKIVNLGATKSLDALCNNEIDVWLYFLGIPNDNYKKIIDKCELRVVSVPQFEVDNFLKIAPFLEKKFGSIVSETNLAARENFDLEIAKSVRNILINHRAELIKENEIFKNF